MIIWLDDLKEGVKIKNWENLGTFPKWGKRKNQNIRKMVPIFNFELSQIIMFWRLPKTLNLNFVDLIFPYDNKH